MLLTLLQLNIPSASPIFPGVIFPVPMSAQAPYPRILPFASYPQAVQAPYPPVTASAPYPPVAAAPYPPVVAVAPIPRS